MPTPANAIKTACAGKGLYDEYTKNPTYTKVIRPHIKPMYNGYVIIKNGPTPDKYGNTGPLCFHFIDEPEFIEIYDTLENVKHWTTVE